MIYTKAKPTSVGEMLREEFLEPLGISQIELAEAMGVSRNMIGLIVRDKSRLTPVMANRLSSVLGMSADFWLNVQHKMDVWQAKKDHCNIERTVRRLVQA